MCFRELPSGTDLTKRPDARQHQLQILGHKIKSIVKALVPATKITVERANGANQTIKEMLKAGKVIKGSNVLILGLTFKEDCPDMRNTQVVKIIDELKDLDANVDVYDPWVDLNEENQWYSHGLISNPLEGEKKYDAIVVAVRHKQFKKYKTADYQKLSNGDEVVIDIENIVDNPTWRL